ncbi:hypothetical protein M2350_000938 [Candidatus Fervidibacter sacchari]|uniref:Uncharacterized protein n=1 Tax=Candidatus Fervidibacter sacchari TaxID=1448929 RepID=A0ABT2ENP9_9BACT|nr:hypothetical protein [Candidatus Fervidibacter sacchari]
MDVCCLNRPFDAQTQERIRLESEALLLILERCERREWDLVVSEAIFWEIAGHYSLRRNQSHFTSGRKSQGTHSNGL